jgi:hypothetical protein
MSESQPTAVQAATTAISGELAGPFVARLEALEDQLAAERERAERAERLATSLAQRVAAEHQRRVAAERAVAVPEREPVPVLAGPPAADDAPAAAPFPRWRTLRDSLDER